MPAALPPDGSLEGLNRQQMSRSCASSWSFGRDPFARPPDRQATAREQHKAAKNRHRAEAENLHRGRGHDSGCLLAAEHAGSCQRAA